MWSRGATGSPGTLCHSGAFLGLSPHPLGCPIHVSTAMHASISCLGARAHWLHLGGTVCAPTPAPFPEGSAPLDFLNFPSMYHPLLLPPASSPLPRFSLSRGALLNCTL